MRYAKPRPKRDTDKITVADREFYAAENKKFELWNSFPIGKTKAQRVFAERLVDKIWLWACPRGLRRGRVWHYPSMTWIQDSCSWCWADGLIEFSHESTLLTVAHEMTHFIEYANAGASDHDAHFLKLEELLIRQFDHMVDFGEVAGLY